MKSKSIAILLASALVALAAATPPPDRIALTNARIIPIVGPEIARGAILIEHGKIAAIGPVDKVEIPFDAREFDLTGKVVMAGLVNVHSQDPLDIPNESRPVTPQLDAADALEPASLLLEDALRLGVTTIHVIPGNDCVIGGLGRAVRPIGLSVAEMTLAPGGFLKLSTAARSGYDRMKQLAELREAFAELNDYLGKTAEKKYEDEQTKAEKPIEVGPAEAKRRGQGLLTADDIDDQHRNLLRLVGGQVKLGEGDPKQLFEPLGAFIYCGKAMDVAPAIKVAKDNGFFERTVLVLGGETFKAVAELKKAALPVVLPNEFVYRETDIFTGREKETFVPKVIADAGLQFAIVPGPLDALAERQMTYQAARCVRAGIGRDTALRAITLNPASMLGLEKILGSLEVGKSANIAVYTGDPLDFESVVELVFVDGVPAYERSKDVRLKRLMAPGGAASEKSAAKSGAKSGGKSAEKAGARE